jgi:hypothetical protein
MTCTRVATALAITVLLSVHGNVDATPVPVMNSGFEADFKRA